MILKFQLSRSALRKIVDDDSLWAKGYTKKDGDSVLNCCGMVDLPHLIDDRWDCKFIVEKTKEERENDKIEPFLLFYAQTLLIFKRWQEQYREYKKKYLEKKEKDDKKELNNLL